MLVCSLLIPYGVPVLAAENWPSIRLTDAQIQTVQDTFDGPYGYFHDTSYAAYMADYSATGNYLNYSIRTSSWVPINDVSLDADGLPMITSNGQTYYNPVTLAQFALFKHGQLIKGDETARPMLVKAADKLLALQSPDGGFSYPIPLTSRDGSSVQPGWRCGMAQGQAISALSRAYLVTQDVRYFNGAALAYHNMQVPVESGGTRASLSDLDPSLAGYLFFPEYPYNRLLYTLNGYMFALLGVYDWSKIRSDTQADAIADFQSGMRTLEKILPYYDLGGFSAYDLWNVETGNPPPFSFGYEGVHVYLLHALNSIAPSPVLMYFERKWQHRIDEANKPLRITTIDFNGKPSPQKVGTPITLDITAEGGTGGGVEYQFGVKFNGDWTTPQPWSTSNTFAWTPDQAGDYALGLWVRNTDGDSKAEFDNYRTVFFTVTP